RHAATDAAPERAPEALESDASEGRVRTRGERRERRSHRLAASEHGCAAACEAQARWKDTPMSEQQTGIVEATGETGGEGKGAALRELEQRVPGLDRENVQFQVVSEGERGLLGVGFTPAHVIASAGATEVTESAGEDATDASRKALEIVDRVAAGIGADVTAS